MAHPEHLKGTQIATRFSKLGIAGIKGFNLATTHINMKKLLICILAVVTMISCDTPTKLIVTNKSNGSASCCFTEKVRIKPDSLFCVVLSEPGSKAIIPLGFGVKWTDDYVHDFSQKFSSLEIIVKGDTLRIFGSEKIFEFLSRQHIKYSRRQLLITIDDALFYSPRE